MVVASVRSRPRHSGDHAHPWMLLQEGHTGRGMPVAHVVVSRAAFFGGDPVGSPALPNVFREPCSKLGITATIEAAAVQVGLPRRSPEGLTLWSGHSLRVGGALSLAKACLDTWTIQLVGWGSQAVLGYVRDAPLAMSHTWPTRASTGPTLGVQLGAVVSEPSQ